MGRWVDGYVGGWKDEKAYPLFFSSDWLSSVRKSTSSVTFLWRVGGWVGGWIWVGGWVGGLMYLSRSRTAPQRCSSCLLSCRKAATTRSPVSGMEEG